jgi:hypothetical protein
MAVLMQQPGIPGVTMLIISQYLGKNGHISQGQVKSLCPNRVDGMGGVTQDHQPLADILNGSDQS